VEALLFIAVIILGIFYVTWAFMTRASYVCQQEHLNVYRLWYTEQKQHREQFVSIDQAYKNGYKQALRDIEQDLKNSCNKSEYSNSH
jgi:hypothetical protein